MSVTPPIIVGRGSVFIAPIGDRLPAGWQDLGWLNEDVKIEREHDGPEEYGTWEDTRVRWRNPLTITVNNVKMYPEAIRLLFGEPVPQKKESTMIDKKKFEKYVNVQQAEDLGGYHIGSLVKVTTDQGVEITDVLTGVHVGEYEKNRLVAEVGKVKITLQHYRGGYQYDDGAVGILLDGKSTVRVRRPLAD